ncbi:MAG: 16S rRNA (uracil(1498)-N(3))-methyltransferase [Verrucomicrobiales bacterium]|nr:16S rRNA (uracil(1498)-N(3))-methyltransferase [Verrucomicrobiales bacterium]
MPKHRFYLSPQDWNPDHFELLGDEAHHCRDVMRCGVGDIISVFDGQGREVEAMITAAEKKAVTLELKSEIPTAPLPAKITLGQAIPKGKNMELIIQKATELGVAKIVPLTTTNTVVRLDEKEKSKKQEKWQRVAIEACKQCGQNWLPEVAKPQSVENYIKETTNEWKIVAAIDSSSRTLKEIIADRQTVPDAVSLLIGPEGDFTSSEVEKAVETGFQPMSLGPIILRSETAAIYTVSVFAYEMMNR